MTTEPVLVAAYGGLWRTATTELLLLFIDITQERVVVGIAQLPDHNETDLMVHLWGGQRMRLEDDVGTVYEFAGGGYLDQQVTETHFRPGPPPEANRLTLRCEPGDAEPSVVDVDLAARTWFGYLGKTKRLDAPRFVPVVAQLADLADGPAVLTGLVLQPGWTTARIHRPGPRSPEPPLPGEPEWTPTRHVPQILIADDHGGSCDEETPGGGGGHWESSRDLHLGVEFGVHAGAETITVRLKTPSREAGPPLTVQLR